MERAPTSPRSRPAHPELAALLARLSAGERAAFQPLFDVLWPILRRFTTRFLGSEADGDDAAQQALLKVFAQAREYDPARAALPWILAIATNECRTLRKLRIRRKEVGCAGLDPLAAHQLSPEQELIRRDLTATLADVFMDLRPEDIQTLAHAVACDRAGRPAVAAATFRKRVERALDRLRLAWRTRHGTL